MSSAQEDGGDLQGHRLVWVDLEVSEWAKHRGFTYHRPERIALMLRYVLL